MPIPELEDNVLPEGVHDCTIDEIEAAFGRFQKSDRRPRLTEKLRQYLKAAKLSDEEPGDIDIIVVLPADWKWPEDIRAVPVQRGHEERDQAVRVSLRRGGAN